MDLGELDQAKVEFGNVLAGKGASVKVDKVKAGTLSFKDVTVGRKPTH